MPDVKAGAKKHDKDRNTDGRAHARALRLKKGDHSKNSLGMLCRIESPRSLGVPIANIEPGTGPRSVKAAKPKCSILAGLLSGNYRQDRQPEGLFLIHFS
jgi:hypothetical protein